MRSHSERVIRFAKIPRAAHPLPIYSDTLEPLPARWAAISICVSLRRAFVLYLLGETGSILESAQYETMRIALGQAHALLGLELSDWTSCELQVGPERLIDPDQFPK
jgi:hypothetical protein